MQLASFLGRALVGDLGWSLAFKAPVTAVIAARWPATMQLAAAGLGLGVAVALPLGLWSAVRRGTAADRAVRALSLTGTCLPTFVLAPLLVLVFAVHLGWLPVSGRAGPASLALPALTLALGLAGVLVRVTRASVLEALGQDWVRTARAKGASEARAVLVHALPNALLPVTAVVGLQAGALLTGAVVTETIFAWPGVGRLVVQAIGARDYPLVQGCVLVLALTYVVVNTLTDLLHALLDPRLRDEG